MLRNAAWLIVVVLLVGCADREPAANGLGASSAGESPTPGKEPQSGEAAPAAGVNRSYLGNWMFWHSPDFSDTIEVLNGYYRISERNGELHVEQLAEFPKKDGFVAVLPPPTIERAGSELVLRFTFPPLDRSSEPEPIAEDVAAPSSSDEEAFAPDDAPAEPTWPMHVFAHLHRYDEQTLLGTIDFPGVPILPVRMEATDKDAPPEGQPWGRDIEPSWEAIRASWTNAEKIAELAAKHPTSPSLMKECMNRLKRGAWITHDLDGEIALRVTELGLAQAEKFGPRMVASFHLDAAHTFGSVRRGSIGMPDKPPFDSTLARQHFEKAKALVGSDARWQARLESVESRLKQGETAANSAKP